MDNLISVIVPVYNSGQYLERCIGSVLAQDHEPLEIIIVDDGSTDAKTRLLCDALAADHPQVRTFHKENGGSASARNYGLDRAAGSYVGFVDSDDTIEPDMYSSLYQDIVGHNVRIAIGQIETIEKGHVVDRVGAIPPGEYSNTELLHYFFLGHWNSVCTNLYERSLLAGVRFPEGEVNEDYLVNYLLFKAQDKVYYDSRVFYHYDKHGGSVTSSPVSLRFADWLRHTELVLEDYGSDEKLGQEAHYQYLFSNIVLGNKCLLTLASGPSQEALQLYSTVCGNLAASREQVAGNRYLGGRYRLFAMMMANVPKFYKALALPALRLKKSK